MRTQVTLGDFRPRVTFDGPRGKSLTQQHFKDECDINFMIRRALTGDSSVFRKGSFGDFTSLPDNLHEVQNKLALANSLWHDLPDNVRATVGSPEALLKLCEAETSKASKSPISEPSENDFKSTVTADNAANLSNDESTLSNT